MAWSQTFIKALSAGSVTAKYTLHFFDMPHFAGSSETIRGGFQSSAPLQISDEGPTINGCSVVPSTFNVSFGGFSVPLVGDITTILPSIRKGSVAELRCTISGVEERIAVGQLKAITGFSQRWVLQFNDILGMLTSRADSRIGDGTDNDPDHFQWFYNCGCTTTINLAWLQFAGNFPAAMSVDDVRPFMDNLENGEKGLAKCVDASGNEFFVEYNSATKLGLTNGTLAMSKIYQTTDKVYPGLNTCSDMAIGTTVTAVAVLKGKPYDIFGKLLLSVDGNGSDFFDQYPDSWNYGGVLPHDIYDVGDAKNQDYIKSTDEAANPYKWNYYIDQPWSNGIRQFIDVCSRTGQFPVYRQNAVTWRGAHNPQNTNLLQAIIRDENIIRINKIDLFDRNQTAIFKRIKIDYGQTTSTNTLSTSSTFVSDMQTIPALSRKELDLKYVYGYDPTTQQTQRKATADGDRNRIFFFYALPSSTISLTLPLMYAGLCAGDMIEIRSKYINVFYDARYGLRGMVIGQSYNIGAQTVSLQVMIQNQVIN